MRQAELVEPVADVITESENDAQVHEIHYSDGSRTYEVYLIDRTGKWRVFECSTHTRALALLSGYQMGRLPA